MNFRLTVAAFVILVAACPFALKAADRDVPKGGGIPDAVDRGMLLDAWEMQQRQQRFYPSSEEVTGSMSYSTTIMPLDAVADVQQATGGADRTNAAKTNQAGVVALFVVGGLFVAIGLIIGASASARAAACVD